MLIALKLQLVLVDGILQIWAFIADFSLLILSVTVLYASYTSGGLVLHTLPIVRSWSS